MKKLISITLILSILSTVFSYALPVAWYLSNYDFIKTELCVNRHIPGSDCNGTCQLKKKIHDHHQENSEAPNNHKNVERIPGMVLFLSESTSAKAEMKNYSHQFRSYQKSTYSFLTSEPTTPPPQVA